MFQWARQFNQKNLNVFIVFLCSFRQPVVGVEPGESLFKHKSRAIHGSLKMLRGSSRFLKNQLFQRVYQFIQKNLAVFVTFFCSFRKQVVGIEPGASWFKDNKPRAIYEPLKKLYGSSKLYKEHLFQWAHQFNQKKIAVFVAF